MSSRPRRSTLAPARFSPSLEEANPKSLHTSQPRQSPAPSKVEATPPPSRKATPAKRNKETPKAKETPKTKELQKVKDAQKVKDEPKDVSKEPKEAQTEGSGEQSETFKEPNEPREQAKEDVQQVPTTTPTEELSTKSTMFVSKSGRLSIPSSKLSPLSFANFGRKCLNISAKMDVVTDTKRRALLQPPPLGSEPPTKRLKKESTTESTSMLSIKAERSPPVPSREDIRPQVGQLAKPTEPSSSSSRALDTGKESPELQVPRIRIKLEQSTATVVGQTTEGGVQVEEQRTEISTTELTFSTSPGPFDQPPILATPQVARPAPLPYRHVIGTPLFEGRKSRNKSKPLSELAPDLLPNRHSIMQRQMQQRERQEAQQRRKSEAEARKMERETIRIRKEQERVARLQRQEHRQEQIQQQQVYQRETEPHYLPASELPSPAVLLQRSARKSLSIKIDEFDSESSIGRRSSKSISSPAVFGKRYAAYGTKATDPLLGNSRFYSRMEHRKFQNPMACGLVPIKSDLNVDDYFYREVLVKRPAKEDTKDVVDDQEIDILTEDTIFGRFSDNDDEILVKNPAFDCVADIRGVLPAPMESEPDENEEEDMSIVDQILEECSVEIDLMHNHLHTLVTSIISQRIVDLNTQGVVGGCSLFYSQTMKNATRLRDQLCLFSEHRIYAIEDAHAYLLRKLSDEYMAAYLNLLRFLKISGSSLTVHLLDHPVDSEVQIANEFIREFVNTKIVDPNLRYGKCSDIVPLSNVSLVLVYPQVSMASQTVIKHAHENMFRNLLPSAVRCVEKVELKFDKDVDPRTLTHMCLAMIRDRVNEIVRRRPDDHVFLAGWGISSLLNMQAIQRVPGVTGILNFAFPLRSFFGFRGSVDDTICVSYCPSLFVVGDAASNVNIRELQTMRENMICESGLIMVGGADNNLYVSPLVLSVERVSQHCVDRIILEHVTDFMKQLISEGGMSAKERRQYLKPVKFPNAFDVDLNTLKGRASGFVPKLRQPKEPASATAATKKKDGKIPSRLSSNPPTPLSSEPSSSMLSSPALPGSATFHRQPPPLLSVASTSGFRSHHIEPSGIRSHHMDQSGIRSHHMDPFGGHDLHDARASFDQALRRRSSVAVCMSEPRNPLSMPITTMAPMSVKREIVHSAPPKPTSALEIQRMMSKEAEEATASITGLFDNENEEADDSAF